MTRRIAAAVAVLAALLPALASAECPGLGELVINEIRYTPKGESFIELWGPPGATLECFDLETANGGPAGDQCDISTLLSLTVDNVIPADGYFVLADAEGEHADLVTSKAKLQLGPDGLALRHRETGIRFDSIAYGGKLDGCEVPVLEGFDAAPLAPSGGSIARAWDEAAGAPKDTNDNGADFIACTTPSPGAQNGCVPPPTCDIEPAAIEIVELQVAPNGAEFVEVLGPPGTDLGCYVIRGLEGETTGETCEIEKAKKLTGVALDDAGRAVLTLDLESTGAYGVELVLERDDGTTVPIDGLRWGADLVGCPHSAWSGSPVVLPASGQSLSLCGDTGDDAVDFIASAPTPGAANDCTGSGGPGGCVGTLDAGLFISEVQLKPNGSEFVELSGTPGMALDCYSVRGLEGGTAGETCDPEKAKELGGTALDAQGYAIVTLDLETTGAYGVEVVFEHEDGTVQSLDGIQWGAQLGACAGTVGSGHPLPIPDDGESLQRCFDTGNDLVDYAVATATQAAANDCETTEPPDPPDPCSPPAAGALVINEVQVGPAGTEFVELYGVAGTSLRCLSIVGYNGGQAATDCAEYLRVPLGEGEVPEGRYVLVAPEASENAPGADVPVASLNIQDGPDALALVFTDDEGIDTVLDAVVYGGELPACAAFSEGAPVAKPKSAGTITRCKGGDTGDNGEDFTRCSKPSPGAITECGCSAGSDPDPSGGGGGGDDGGCSSATGPLVPWSLALLVLLGLALARRRAR
jgi:hypothetical protein